ncbi:hypothetical protein CFOL_v3_07776 [Cephalotus follicularis]|uniref:Uncharacterized protein n=1 Tax=Cephalotus follicularis TaxID=3775 RepID=A0A1Q3B8D8_CEPFO|nr:hypothetical protein CFOL_v3_07776 [Cephalotus follicularis]
MESNRKRRGFIKGKLMPFYRTAKPTVQFNSKVNPNQSYPSSSFGYMAPQDYVIAQPKPRVSFIVPDNNRDKLGNLDNPFGVAGDESVDLKAAIYISSVQERFKLEGNNSERLKYQDQHAVETCINIKMLNE